MKLNFRSVDGGGTLAHGVTPVLIPTSTRGPLSSRSTLSHGQGGLLDGDPSVNGAPHAGLVPVSPRTRRFHLSCGTGMLCLLVVAVICVLPSVLPAAVRHVERLVDWSRTLTPADAGLKPIEISFGLSSEIQNSTGALPGSRAFIPMTGQQTADPLLPPVKKESTEVSAFPPPVPVSASTTDFALNHVVSGTSASSAPLPQTENNVRDRTNYSFNSYGVMQTMLGNKPRRPMSESDRLEPMLDEWNKYVVVRHGNLYMSETFEARLNEQVAEKIFERHPELFGHVQRDCGGRPDISFSFNTSPVIQAELEIVTQCGPEGSSCTLRPRVDDLKRLHVNVGSGQAGEHFLTADATKESGRVTWGPLVGPLKVTLLEESLLALKKTCPDQEASATRILSVGQVKAILREIAQRERSLSLGERENGGSRVANSRFDVFRYDAHPHHHIRQSGAGNHLENGMVRQQEKIDSSGDGEGSRSREHVAEMNNANHVFGSETERSGGIQEREGASGERKRDWVMTRVDSPGGQ